MRRRHVWGRLQRQARSYRVGFVKFMMRLWGVSALSIGAYGLLFPYGASENVPFTASTTSQLGFGLIAIGLATLTYLNLYMFKGRHG